MAGTAARRELSQPLAAPFEQARYDIAVPDDEAHLRSVLRESSMPGSIRVSFTREPNYFHAEGLLDARDTTVVARKGSHIIGLGRCSMRSLYVNGSPRWVGYLSELRVRSSEPGGVKLLRGGYEFFRDYAAECPAEFYFTSISSANTRVQRLLENGSRWGLPQYRFLTELITLVAPIKSRSGARTFPKGVAFSKEELTAFLDAHAKVRNLSLVWDDNTWASLEAIGLSWNDFVVVRHDGQIVAAALLWDQRAVRQTVVAGYSNALAVLRPWLNAWYDFRGLPRLPAANEILPQACLLGLTVAVPQAWPALWTELSARANHRALRWLTWSSDKNDPEWSRHQCLTGARVYRTRLYSVHWPALPKSPCAPGDLLYQPEVGLL